MKILVQRSNCFNKMKWYKAILITRISIIFTVGVNAQNVEVHGRLKVTEMDTMNSENLLVVKKSDGTLAGRQVSSLSLPVEDTTRTLGTDLALTMALCNCESLPPAMIESLLDHGYSTQDLIAFGMSPMDLFHSGVPIDSLFGDFYKGGLIFYLDTSDLYPFEGLVAAIIDQSSGTEWGCYGTAITGADGSDIGAGEQNTIDIEAECSTAGIAADLCANLVLNGYDDWFLPSIDEIDLMWENLADLDGDGINTGPGDPGNPGNFVTDSYWSSTEVDSETAKSKYFGSGSQDDDLKDFVERVRAVRSF